MGTLLLPEAIEGKYPSIEALKADPRSTVDDLYQQCHASEAALRRANRDQMDAAALLTEEINDYLREQCGWWKRVSGRCP